MNSEDYGRATRAVAALKLTGANKEVAGYWLSGWRDGKPLHLRAFDKDRISAHAPALSLYEVREDTVRCISAGAYLKLAIGFDLGGQDILSLTNAGDRDERLAWAWQIVKGAVGVSYRSYKSKTAPGEWAQGISLPFGDDKPGGPRYFLKHTNWRPVASDWMEGNVTVDLQIPAKKQIISFKPQVPADDVAFL